MKTLQENLKLFYLGTHNNEAYFYKNKDLTTHALIIGMTGSGKTGFGISLLEEACIDNIPSIVIDPKGDLNNLALSFTKAEEFLPFIDEDEANSKNISKMELAKTLEENLKNGLNQTFQSIDRVELFKQSANIKIFTPNSRAGLGVNLLSDLSAPNLNDEELHLHTLTLATSLLTLANINSLDSTSPEVLLLQSILNHNFLQNKSLNITTLIEQIVNPPFDKIGVFDINSFFTPQKRMSLAMKINTLVASPSFAMWSEGQSLDISKMLFDENGKANANIFSISHLNDNQRMFFVSILLNQVLNWMRSQNGTSSLRAILYMDEIFGFFPPNANPPSKEPMMSLLKQARAFGLGCVLATQNPVDIDYKGLSNIGTWFIGRLQTSQDIQKVASGLGGNFNKNEIENLLSNMQKRHFLVKNINDDELKIIKTRYALSYLKGPLNKDEISTLMAAYKTQKQSKKQIDTSSQKPIISQFINEAYCINSTNELKAYLYATASVRFCDNKGLEHQENLYYLYDLEDARQVIWNEASKHKLNLNNCTLENASYGQLASFIASAKDLKEYKKSLKDFIYTTEKLNLYKGLDLCSNPNESKEEFYIRLQDKANEILEEKTEIFMKKFQMQKTKIEEKLRKAEEKVQKEKSDLKKAGLNAALNIGSAILGFFNGRSSNISKAASGARSANQALVEKNQLKNAEFARDAILNELEQLMQSYENELQTLKEQYDIKNITLETKTISPKKSDIFNEDVVLLWKN